MPPDEGVTTNKSIDEDDEICPRTVTDENISYIFRTYKSPFTKDNEPTRYKGTLNGKNITVASSLRASTAAPVYFERKTMSICGSSFIDGGVTNNNPSEIALSEMTKLFPKHKNFCLVSIGTGKVTKTNTSSGWFFSSSNNQQDHVGNCVNTLLDIFQLSMSSESIHRRVYDQVNQSSELSNSKLNISYYRLNPPFETEIPLDSTSPENFELMIAKTREYLRSEESFNKLIKQIKKRI